jgi:hypothetical protein
MISALLRKRKQPNKIGAFEIDVTVSESHGRSAQATGNPIEGGSIINDHVINDPKTVTMTGVISNTPLRTFGIGSDDARVQDAFDALEEIFDSREPFDLQTGLKLYRDCVFTSLTMPKTRAGELRFSASFQELTIVRTELATIPADALSPNDAAFSSERDAGRQQGIEPNEAQASSLLVNVTRAVRGLL